MKHIYFYFMIAFLAMSCEKDNPIAPEEKFMYLSNYMVDNQASLSVKGASTTPEINLHFSEPLNPTSIEKAILASAVNGQNIELVATLSNEDSTLHLQFPSPLSALTNYNIKINTLLQSKKQYRLFSDVVINLATSVDSTLKFPIVSDTELLNKIQQQNFRFFWDFAHPNSGMARERNSSGDLVTSGGTGFGIMAIITAIHNGFISRTDGLERVNKIVDFLSLKADRFHGAFPHWLNGNTGKTIPFSQKDDGADLVETSYLMAGLLCAKEYFEEPEAAELRNKIQSLWEAVEWSWFTKNDEKVLYWHWSPNFGWAINLPVRGWNEALITYVLAAASPTFPIDKAVYDNGWTINGNMKNGKSFLGIPLPLGPDFGGPLFFSHYTFLGIDPRNLRDQYANYFEQVVNHSLINYTYCTTNPKKYYGYSADCWGLTASDTKGGYTAHSPTNDRGVISPTAALSSMPFTPEQSMKAARFFYFVLGDKIFKEQGFIDAFSLHELWFADSFLAIDQGPIVIMIENHKTGLIWTYTMKNADIRNGLDKLGFTY